MPRPKTVPDSTVLAAARRIFQRDGHAASTRNIAREAGLSQAALYQRFGSKEKLFFAAMMPEPPDLTALLDGDEAASARAYLDTVTWRLFRYMQEHIPLVWHAVHHPAFDVSELADAHDHLAGPLQDALASKLSDFRSRGDLSSLSPPAVAQTVIALVHSLALKSVMSPPASTRRTRRALRAMLEVLWCGLQPTTARGAPQAGTRAR